MADEETGRGERVYIHLWLVKESSHGEEKVPCNVPLHESGRSLLPYGRCLFKACPAGITGQSVGTTPKKPRKHHSSFAYGLVDKPLLCPVKLLRLFSTVATITAQDPEELD